MEHHAVFHCPIVLAKNQVQDRFFAVHSELAKKSAIIGCANEVSLHREMEEKLYMSNKGQ
jgi:hypothetical protein